MLSKNKIKYIQSLRLKKFRQKYNNFIAEGEKIVGEMLSDGKLVPELLFATKEWIEKYPKLASRFGQILTEISEKELKKISALSTPNKILAIVKIPGAAIDPLRLQQGLSLYLDGIRDPGNLGTIFRIADWFSLDYLICSPDSAAVFQPKVIQSSMGAFLRVPAIRMAFPTVREMAPDLPVYGTVLEGENVFTQQLSSKGIIIIGNESKGIREETATFISNPVSIPPGPGAHAESLNAAVATGIICALFRNFVR